MNKAWMKEKLKKECYICGCKKELEVHHKIPLHFGGSDTTDNQIFLCTKHHKKLHKIDYENPTAKDYLKRLNFLKWYG